MALNEEQREINAAPVSAAVRLLAEAVIDVVEADIQARTIWEKITPTVSISDLAKSGPYFTSGSGGNSWSMTAGKVAERQGGDVAFLTAGLFDLLQNVPKWKDDEDLTKGTPKDRVLFMDLIAEAEECKRAVDAARVAKSEYAKAVAAWQAHLNTIEGGTPHGMARYQGLYVTVSTSRRKATGWVTHSTAKSLTIREDIFTDLMPINGSRTEYRTRSYVSKAVQARNAGYNYGAETKFADNATVRALLPRKEADARRRLVSGWVRDISRAMHEQDTTYMQWQEWLEKEGGKAASMRREAIERFDWTMVPLPISGYYEHNDTHRQGKAWFAHAYATLKDAGLLDTVVEKARQDVFVNVTGGPLTDEEKEVLSREPVVLYRNEVDAVTAEAIKAGVVDRHRTIF